MKTKYADFVYKILFIVIASVLSGLIIAFLIGLYKDKRQELNTSTGKIKNMTGSVANFDYEAYNGATISGETLISLIQEVDNEDSEFSIAVQTYANANKSKPVTIYYNRVLSSPANNIISGTPATLNKENKSSDDYITPTATFYGEVLKNPNDEVTGILFVQRK